MRWPDRFRWHRGTPDPEASLDLAGILAEGLRNPTSARQAIARLKRERKAGARQRRNAHRRSGVLTPGRVRSIGRSSSSRGSPGLEAYQLSSAMRDAGTASPAATLRAEQLASIEERLQAIDRALVQLATYARQAR